ncbi:hypothetical protein HDV03_000718 [Kappamyces sp. JEL0829]|nr:hypothetical protein HDV03_000718 [Kappamyces sp. JEL0829]
MTALAKNLLRNALKFIVKPPPPVLRVGHPILMSKAVPVKSSDLVSSTSPVGKIAQDMTKVFSSSLTPVIGLSANQLGHSVRMIAYQIKDPQTLKEKGLKEPVPLTFLVNPHIVSTTGPETAVAEYEFCESVPLYSGVVKRPLTIHVQALDLEGRKVDRKYTGFVARVIQHEIDHLDGICFVDRVEKQTLRHDAYLDQFQVHLAHRR